MRLLTSFFLEFLGLILYCLFSVSQAVVYTITTVNHKLDPGTLQYSHIHKRHQAQLKQRVGLKAYQSRSQGSLTTKNRYFLALANISVGTLAQTFIVETDFFWLENLILIYSKADLSSVIRGIPNNYTFNSSDSSTFTTLDGNFSSYFGDGHKANDILALGDTIRSKVDFGLLDTVSSSLSYYSSDGLLGLAPAISNSASINLTTILDQLSAVLDEPVITIWTNNTEHGSGSSVGTLGAIDTEHCQSNWIYVPEANKDKNPYNFHVSSVEMTLNGGKQTLGLNKTLIADQYTFDMYMPDSLRAWFLNATNAVYDSKSGYYKVDCDTSKAAKLIFNIGGEGNTTSSANKQLVISAADYVLYSEYDKFCYVAVKFLKHTSLLEMNIQFMNNHCLAYNIKNKSIGIADSKTILMRKNNRINMGIQSTLYITYLKGPAKMLCYIEYYVK